jgi:putative transposase
MLRMYHYRRRLPHFQPENRIFFITCCTYLRWVLPESARSVVLETCLTGNGRLFRLHGVIVMPDHLHLLLTPLRDQDGAFSIPQIMQAIKGSSAHGINKRLGRRGKVWQEESFDYMLRRGDSVAGKIEYMMGNPVRAGQVENPLEYRWLLEGEWGGLTGGDARRSIIYLSIFDEAG